jgi:hypothetical protein
MTSNNYQEYVSVALYILLIVIRGHVGPLFAHYNATLTYS